MTTRRFKGPALVVSVVLGLIAGVVFAVPATAGAAQPIHGDLKCAVGATQMHFAPALVLSSSNPTPSRSLVTFIAPVTACRGTTPTSPAPGGIHHGVMELMGRLKRNDCEDLTAVPGYSGTSLYGPQRLKLTWYDASGERVGRNPYGADQKSLMLVYDFPAYPFPTSPIATIPFSRTLRATAKAFGGEHVSTRIPHNLTDFSHQCAAGPVAAIPLLAGAITIGNPT